MIDTTGTTAKCRFAKYVRLPANFNRGIYYKIDANKMAKKHEILAWNIRNGSAKPCLCMNCNPDTSNSRTEL